MSTIASTAICWDASDVNDESSSAQAAAGGLITRRMAAERGRAAAISFVVAGAFFLFSAGARGFGLVEDAMTGAPPDALGWLLAVAGVAVGVWFCVNGIQLILSRKKRIADFNAEHGSDAGQQR